MSDNNLYALFLYKKQNLSPEDSEIQSSALGDEILLRKKIEYFEDIEDIHQVKENKMKYIL